MQVGFIGAGNMARVLARGLGDPVSATDAAQQLGGEAIGSNRALAERADHDPRPRAALGAVIDR